LSGIIALKMRKNQGRPMLVYFKDLRLKRLTHGTSDSNGNALSTNWIPLFDGHSVEGWVGEDSSTFPSRSWKMEGGELKNIPAGPKISLFTRDRFHDFELQFEWQIGYGGNSGVFYSEEYRVNGRAIHREFQLLDDDKTHFPNGGESKFPEDDTGALWGVIAPASDKVLHPAGEWNVGKLLVNGTHVEHWINGRKVVDYELSSTELKGKIENSPANYLKANVRASFTEPGNTPIGLQDLSGGVSFRNIRIRRLTGSGPLISNTPARMLTPQALAGRRFRFSWQSGNEYGLNGIATLNKDGTISGIKSPNESFWFIDGDGRLIFKHRDGRTSTVFNTAGERNGKLFFSGPFQFLDNIVHELEEVE
jgi:hypothetical protein